MMLVASCPQRKSSSASERKLRLVRSSIDQTRGSRAIMDTPVRNQRTILVARQTCPTVRSITKKKISRAPVKVATFSYMDQIPIDKNNNKKLGDQAKFH